MKIPDIITLPGDPKYITYQTRFWKALMANFGIDILFSISFYALITTLITNRGTFAAKLIILLLVIVFGSLLAYVFSRYLASSKQVIQISQGNDIFYFGDVQNMNRYDKKNIEKIIIYQPGGSQPGGVRKLHFFYVFEIYFKDSTILKFSNMLLSEATVLDNFLNDLITYGDKSPFWRL